MNLATVFVPNSGGYGTEGAIDRGNAEGLDSGTYALLPVSAGATVEAERVEWCSACRGEHSGTRADGMGLCGHPKEQVWVVRETRTEEEKP